MIQRLLSQQIRSITSINFSDKRIQLSNDELGIGNLHWCGEFEHLAGREIENVFFESVLTFYETSVFKIISKFPFKDQVIKDFAFLDPRNHDKTL